MKTRRTKAYRLTMLTLAYVSAAGTLLLTGCGEKSEDAADTASPAAVNAPAAATGAANVPAEASQAAAAQQAAGQQRGMDEAARAAAYNAARAKAEGR